jgi:hypothetical protein
VVALESGQEFESFIAASNCCAFFAGIVAICFRQIDPIVYLMDLLFGKCRPSHIDVGVEFRMIRFTSLDVIVTSKPLWVERIQSA